MYEVKNGLVLGHNLSPGGAGSLDCWDERRGGQSQVRAKMVGSVTVTCPYRLKWHLWHRTISKFSGRAYPGPPLGWVAPSGQSGFHRFNLFRLFSFIWTPVKTSAMSPDQISGRHIKRLHHGGFINL